MSGDKVRPCVACNRLTRPPRASIKNYPGTAQRARDKCVTCHRNDVKPLAVRPSTAEINAGLEQFLAARREREAAAMRREQVSA